MSLDTAAALAVLIETISPTRIADLGSGFSSLVVRFAAPNAEVWSVDDSEEWLGRTAEYLSDQGVNSGHLVTWDIFCQRSNEESFDIVSHDLGNMGTRLSSLSSAAARVRRDGWLLLDDMHKIGYGPFAWAALAHLGFDTYSLRQSTLDEMGRYSVLARRNIRTSRG